MKLAQSYFKAVFEDHLFNEDVYSGMKSSAKFKFLFIALSYWRLAVESVGVWDPKLKAREALLDTLVGPNFLRVLVKNVSNTKAQLHDEANSVKSALVTFLQTSELSSATCLRLLTQLFGPNTTTRLSVKKHVDLVKITTTSGQTFTIISETLSYQSHVPFQSLMLPMRVSL